MGPQLDLARIESVLREYDANPSPANQQRVVALKLEHEASDRASKSSRRNTKTQLEKLDKLSFWSDMAVPGEIAKITQRARLLPHQHHVKIALSPESEWRSMLMVHDVGTGKSRTAMAVAENLLRERTVSRVYVLGPSALRGNYVREIAPYHQATYERGVWDLPDSVGRQVYANRALTVSDHDPSALRRALWGIVRNSYTFIGYREFHNRFASVPPEQLSVIFADTLIVVDEAHNLRVQSTDKESKKVTPLLRQILADSPNTRLLLMTATPMFDMDTEIITLINMMNINDNRPEIRSMDDVTEAVRSRVSVYHPRRYDPRFPIVFPISSPDRDSPVPGFPSVTTASYKWPGYDTSGAPVKPLSKCSPSYIHHVAGKHQAVSVAAEDDIAGEAIDEATSLIRQTVCNIVYPPSNQSSEKAFSDVFDMQRGTYSPGYEGFFVDAYRQYGAKLANIVDCIENTVRGPTVVFSNFLWAGIYPIALALEELGYRPVGSPSLLKTTTTKGTNLKYAVVAKGNDKDRIVSQFNRAANSEGGEISVLLCTRAVAEGVDLKNVRVLHVVEPWWNRGLTTQIIGRATRIYSHVAQELEHRNVVVYEHLLASADDRESYDHYIARTAEAKVARVTRVVRIMESESFDCSLTRSGPSTKGTKGGNLSLTDAFGQSHSITLSDYEALKYGRSKSSSKCSWSPPLSGPIGEISRATMEDLVFEFASVLGTLFAKAKWYTLDEIRAAIPIDEALLYKTMAHILFHRYPVRVNGLSHALLKKDDVYVLENLAIEGEIDVASNPISLADEQVISALETRAGLKDHLTDLVEKNIGPADTAAVERIAEDPDFIFFIKKGRMCKNMIKKDIITLGRQVFGDAVATEWESLSKRDICFLVRYTAEIAAKG